MPNRLWKFLNCLLISAAVLAGGGGAAQAQIGIAAGLNFEQAGDISDAAGNLSQDVALSEATGYHVGLLSGAVPGAVPLPRPGRCPD